MLFFIISDLYRVLTEIAEVHADIARRFCTFYLNYLTPSVVAQAASLNPDEPRSLVEVQYA